MNTGSFYKYNGPNSGLLHDREVYLCEAVMGNINYLVSNKGEHLSVEDDSRFVKSGVQYDNWMNKEYPVIEDKVNHPSHYSWLKDKCGVEAIDIARHLDFNLGNAIKYILRAGHKTEEGYSNKDKTIEDLNKAIFYLQDEINLIHKES